MGMEGRRMTRSDTAGGSPPENDDFRDRYAMHLSRRCGARTRTGSLCRSPVMPNGQCRMHGGPSPGAPSQCALLQLIQPIAADFRNSPRHRYGAPFSPVVRAKLTSEEAFRTFD